MSNSLPRAAQMAAERRVGLARAQKHAKAHLAQPAISPSVVDELIAVVVAIDFAPLRTTSPRGAGGGRKAFLGISGSRGLDSLSPDPPIRGERGVQVRQIVGRCRAPE